MKSTTTFYHLNPENFFNKGWCKFDHDPLVDKWVHHSLAAARQAVNNPGNAQWLRHSGTWFVGVNVLDNDNSGAVKFGPRMAGRAVDFINIHLKPGNFNWDRAQVSICYPGYPARSSIESENAFNYRLRRDAAHVDGLRREGPDRRRFLREFHGFILGIPMTKCSHDASPFVMWEGSHKVIRDTLFNQLESIRLEKWGDVDLTDLYQAVRKQIFQHCNRIELFAEPGQCYLVHRLALHGIAPWGKTATASGDGRMICYFRPEFLDSNEWLTKP